MKYWIIGIVALAIIAASYWAGTQQGSKAEKTPTPLPTALVLSPSYPPDQVVVRAGSPLPGEIVIGNKPGNRAPDFRLKDASGKEVSLRDYLYTESVVLEFLVSGEIRMQGKVFLDPDNAVHRLYGVTSIPYTVNIDINGIIR